MNVHHERVIRLGRFYADVLGWEKGSGKYIMFTPCTPEVTSPAGAMAGGVDGSQSVVRSTSTATTAVSAPSTAKPSLEKRQYRLGYQRIKDVEGRLLAKPEDLAPPIDFRDLDAEIKKLLPLRLKNAQYLFSNLTQKFTEPDFTKYFNLVPLKLFQEILTILEAKRARIFHLRFSRVKDAQQKDIQQTLQEIIQNIERVLTDAALGLTISTKEQIMLYLFELKMLEGAIEEQISIFNTAIYIAKTPLTNEPFFNELTVRRRAENNVHNYLTTIYELMPEVSKLIVSDILLSWLEKGRYKNKRLPKSSWVSQKPAEILTAQLHKLKISGADFFELKSAIMLADS